MELCHGNPTKIIDHVVKRNVRETLFQCTPIKTRRPKQPQNNVKVIQNCVVRWKREGKIQHHPFEQILPSTMFLSFFYPCFVVFLPLSLYFHLFHFFLHLSISFIFYHFLSSVLAVLTNWPREVGQK